MTMIKKSFLTGLTVVTLSFSTISLAAYGLPETAPAPAFNWYIGAFGGITYTPSVTDNPIINDIAFEGTDSFNNPNWDVGGHFGYRWDPVRLELEYLYQRSEYGSISTNGVDLINLSGHARVHAAMANVLYDINLDSFVTPYVGVGIGYANISFDVTSGDTEIAPGAFVFADNTGSGSRFGYQVMAGVDFNVMENTRFNLGYRFFGTAGSDSSTDVRFRNHLFNVGLDYYFM